ncbi:oxygenase [Phormidium tenue FACHB-886]|nr:oxygenase [Phormidium tenue FACHB-886]
MRKIAIIGAGQAGLHLGIGLVDAGYAVTLFSDRTPEAIQHGKPMGTPILFSDTLQLERNLGLNFWNQKSNCVRFCSEVCDPEGNAVLALSADLQQHWQAVDQRLKFPLWIQEFVRRGGELVIQATTLEDLEKYVQTYDLIMVTTGRGSFSTLFERDAQKSEHDQPKRHVVSLAATGLKGNTVDLHTARMTALPGIGELVQFPFYANGKFATALGFSACIGGAMDQFSQAQSGQELLEIGKKAIQQLKPDYYEAIAELELVDEQAWVKGAITPIVRHPVGHLPSGAVVMGMGDVVLLHDPIAGQGANNATKMAHLVKQRIIEQGNQRFDAAWMQRVFDEFWHYAQHSRTLTDSLLTPPEHLQDLMVAMADNPAILVDYLQGFNHPPSLSSWFFDAEAAQNYLAQKAAISNVDRELVLTT